MGPDRMTLRSQGPLIEGAAGLGLELRLRQFNPVTGISVGPGRIHWAQAAVLKGKDQKETQGRQQIEVLGRSIIAGFSLQGRPPLFSISLDLIGHQPSNLEPRNEIGQKPRRCLDPPSPFHLVPPKSLPSFLCPRRQL